MKMFDVLEFMQKVVLIFSPYPIDKKRKNSFIAGGRNERADEFAADLYVIVSQRMGYGMFFDGKKPIIAKSRMYGGVMEIANMPNTYCSSIVDQYETVREIIEKYIGEAKMDKPIKAEWRGISCADLQTAIKLLFDFEVDGRKGDYTLSDGSYCSDHLYRFVMAFLRNNRLVLDEELNADFISHRPVAAEQKILIRRFVNKMLGV